MWTPTKAKVLFIEWAAVASIAALVVRELWRALSPLLLELKDFWKHC